MGEYLVSLEKIDVVGQSFTVPGLISVAEYIYRSTLNAIYRLVDLHSVTYSSHQCI